MIGQGDQRRLPANGQERLRVAQIITTLNRGGAQATVVASADLGRYGVEVTVLAGGDRSGEGDFWDHPVFDRSPLVLVPPLVRSVSPVQDLRALRWLIQWLGRNRPDVVHTHSAKAGVLGRLAAAVVGIPCVHTVHGWGPLHSRRVPVRIAARGVERVMARLARRLVVVGSADLDTGLAYSIGRPDQYAVIRSGVELDPTGRAEANRLRRQLGLEGRYVVGMVARLAHPKDHETLLRAFAAAGLADAILVLVGDGPDRDRVAALIDELDLGPCCRLIGARPDAATVVASFDVAVLSSRWEGMPRTVVEAAAAGVPVVSADVGSVRDLIEPMVSGQLFAPGHVDGLAAALRFGRSHPDQVNAMATRARRRAEEFSAESMRRELAWLWWDTAGRGPGPGLLPPRLERGPDLKERWQPSPAPTGWTARR